MARGLLPQPPSRLALVGRITGDDRGTPLPDHDQAFIREHGDRMLQRARADALECAELRH